MSMFPINRYLALSLLVLITVMTAVVVLSPDRYSRGIRWRATRAWLIATGRLVDVGGYRLRIECSGSGPSTVVFDGGLNQPRKSWGEVPAKVDTFARVCTYDRAGVGESDRAGVIRTSANAVDELRTLLEKVGEKPPYVLVAHSFGGQNARLFAAQHPSDVLAMVLIEPTHEDEYQTMNHLRPPEVQLSDRDLMRGENPEGIDLLTSNALIKQLKQLSGSHNVATTVLSSTLDREGVSDEERSLHRELQLDIARTTHASQQQFVEQSGHFVQLDHPQLVVDTIRAALVSSSSPIPH